MNREGSEGGWGWPLILYFSFKKKEKIKNWEGMISLGREMAAFHKIVTNLPWTSGKLYLKGEPYGLRADYVFFATHTKTKTHTITLY